MGPIGAQNVVATTSIARSQWPARNRSSPRDQPWYIAFGHAMDVPPQPLLASAFARFIQPRPQADHCSRVRFDGLPRRTAMG
jgi:hypothetical protein